MNTSVKDVVGAEAIETWLVRYISTLLEIDAAEIKRDKQFSRFGLDSASIAAMACEASEWLGIEIDPVAVYEFSTVSKLSTRLAQYLQPSASLA